MAEKFGELLSNSWKEFKLNFKNFFLIILLLSFIPSTVFFIFEIFLMKDFFNLMASDPANINFSQIFSVFLGINGIILGIVIIASIFISVWFQSSLFYFSLNTKKSLSLGKILTGGAKYYWKLFGLMIVMFLVFFVPILVIAGIIATLAILGIANSGLIISIIVILSLLIVAYIVFLIYLGIKWLFSFYVLIGENKRIFESLREGGRLVKRKWWRTFGYALLFLLIIYAISILFSIPSMIVNFIISFNQISGASGGFSGLLVITMAVSFVFNLLSQIIIIPLCVLFFKNFYLERKKGSKK